MHVLDRALELALVEGAGDGRTRTFAVHLDEELWVGTSGPWGGYVSALFAKAMAEVAGELELVSLTVHFVRRLRAGAAELTVGVETLGRRVRQVIARLVQDGSSGAIAVATLALNPQPDFVSDLVRPDAPPAESVERRTESTHPYMQHLDVRPTVLVRPWKDGNEGTLMGWIRPADPRPLDVPLLAALPDGWTPGMWARLTTPAGKVTVNMTSHFRSQVPSGECGWCFIRVRTRHVERGFADEDAEVWAPDGRLLVQSRQLVLLGR